MTAIVSMGPLPGKVAQAHLAQYPWWDFRQDLRKMTAVISTGPLPSISWQSDPA